MNKLKKELLEYKDIKNAEFQKKLTPVINETLFLGVRVPNIRKLAKKYQNDVVEVNEFLDELPHKCFDENLLHSVLISNIKDYDECLRRIDMFLPYVDNWAVCDTLSPKIFKKNRKLLIKQINRWIKSKHTYTCRFAIDMLMSNYLDEDYKVEYLNLPAKVHSDEYYINMMIAWFYATALAKKWDDTIIYLQENKLNVWVHNKTIQKAIESYRISEKQKQYLKTLRIK